MCGLKYSVGTRIGGATITARTKNSVTYLCDCGSERSVGIGAIYLRVKTGITHCIGCRRFSHVSTQCRDCARHLRKTSNVAAERSLCAQCRRRSRAASRDRRRVEAAGRVCVGCGRNDSNCNWSRRARLCGACGRAGDRNGWCDCGAPMWTDNNRRPRGCRANCTRNTGESVSPTPGVMAR